MISNKSLSTKLQNIKETAQDRCFGITTLFSDAFFQSSHVCGLLILVTIFFSTVKRQNRQAEYFLWWHQIAFHFLWTAVHGRSYIYGSLCTGWFKTLLQTLREVGNTEKNLFDMWIYVHKCRPYVLEGALWLRGSWLLSAASLQTRTSYI